MLVEAQRLFAAAEMAREGETLEIG
jgi:hypothetical protein